WTASGAAKELPALPGATGALAVGVSSDGKITVGGSIVGGTSVATLWDSSDTPQAVSDVLMRAGVSIGDWQLYSVVAISADGKVVVGNGWGSGAPTAGGAWIAWLP